MLLGKVARLVERVIYPISRIANAIGVALVAIIMLFITADVGLRALADLPVLGPITFEAIGFMMVILIFFAVAHSQFQRSHISVDIVVSRLPIKIQSVIGSITNFISMGLFGIMAWRSVVHAQYLRETGIQSATLPMHLPVSPFLLLVAFGSGLLCLVLFINFLDSLAGVVKK